MRAECLALVVLGGVSLGGLAGCIPSNVVAIEDRAVDLSWTDDSVWAAGSREDLPGLWTSIELSGPLAASLQKLVYLFEADGRFTGAALFAGPPAEFGVLTGSWQLDAPGQLRLGEDAEPAELDVAEGLLRIRGAEGVVVLRREELR